MKRVLAALILVLFVFNIMGYYFVFSYNQYLVRGEMKNFIAAGYFKDSYIILRIANPLTDPDFIRVGKGEFRFRDKLYDIVSEKKEGSITIFHCINDKIEERLLSGFHQYFELASAQKNPVKARHAQALLYHVIKLAIVETLRNKPPRVSIEISYIHPIHHLSSIIHPPDFPPPKFS